MSNQLRAAVLSVLGIFSMAASEAAPFAVIPTADAYVAAGPGGSLANNNYGGGGALALAAPGLPKGEFQSVLKFDLAGARASFDAEFGAGLWSVQSITLQLGSSLHNNAIYNDVAPGSFQVSLLRDSSWTEGNGNASNPGASGITFNTLQSTYTGAGDKPLGIFSFDGGTSGVRQYSLSLPQELQSDIASGSRTSLRLFAADDVVSYQFTSRAGTAGAQPQLLITAIPEPATLAIFGLGVAVFLLRRTAKALQP